MLRYITVEKEGTAMWENKNFRVRLEENAMQDFEKVMLTSGECNLFIPMGFVSENGREYGNYNCSGFAPLSSYRIERTEDALYILENVLIILKSAVEYYIDPAKVTVTSDTVFYNKDTGQIKIAYIPLRAERINRRKNIVSFIGQLKIELCDGKEKYLVEAAKYIYYHNYSLREMINKAGMLKRQLYMELHGDDRAS